MESYFLLSKNVKQGFRTLLQPKLLTGGLLAIASIAVLAPAGAAHASQREQGGNKAACDGSSSRAEVAYNRQGWCGYFDNEGWTAGPGLRGGSWNKNPRAGGSWVETTEKTPAVPKSVDTAEAFIDMVVNDLEKGDQRAVTSAQFIILSTLGVSAEGTEKVKRQVTPEQLEEWKKRVMSYADEGELQGVSAGQNGSIEWFDDVHLPCGSVNTYYQIAQDDVAPFQVNQRNTPECRDKKSTEEFITFRDTDGNTVFQIKRICMNAAGEIGILNVVEEEETEGPIRERPQREREREFTPQEEELTEEPGGGQGGERETPRATPASVVPDEEVVEKEQIAQAKAELASTGAPVIFMTIGAVIIIASGLLLATRNLWSRQN